MNQSDMNPNDCAHSRVEGLWFSRDTIVIRAETKIFQVSRAILAARSTVFRDMIAFPQPTSGDVEIVDGSPVVELHDSAADVEVFLRAIFDSSFFMPAPEPIELSVVLGILRLSHKYDVQYLFRRALQHLAEGEWYALTFSEPCADHLITGDPSPIYSLNVVVAAIEVGALWLLPLAYYDATTFGAEKLLPLSEGTLAPHIIKCVVAQARLLRGTTAVNEGLASKSLPGLCPMPEACDRIRLSLLAEYFDQVQHAADLDPLSYWEADVTEGLVERFQFNFAADEIWADLPALFGLPPWDELHAMKRTMMGENELPVAG